MSSNRTEKIRLRQIRYWIEWVTRGFATGKWDSLFLGRGFEFQGTVPFADDPDIVRVNWQATMASGELQVSQFSEEKNVNIRLMGDLSPSMAFGTSISKLDRLAFLAAVLSFSALKVKDSFSFVGFSDKVEKDFPHSSDKSYPFLLASAIMDFPWQGKGKGGLTKAALTLPRSRSMVVIISDFLGDLWDTEGALRILATDHELLPIVIWDDLEVSLPGKGWGFYPLQDLATGEVSQIFLTEKRRDKYRKNALERQEMLRRLFIRYGVRPHFMIGGKTDDDLESLMKVFLTQRKLV